MSERISPVSARVTIEPMRLSDGRTDYFVQIKVGDRAVTPHVFREEYKAVYHVALYDWLLNGTGEEPCPVDFGPDDWPARKSDLAPCLDLWRTIETAPKDGASILVCHAGKSESWRLVYYAPLPMDEAYVWRVDDGDIYRDTAFTHWMPLPATPQGPDTSTDREGK